MNYGRWKIERTFTKMNGRMQWIWIGEYTISTFEHEDIVRDHCCAFSLKDLMQLIKAINKAKR